MNPAPHNLRQELKVTALTAFSFAVWLVVLILLKHLLLAQYEIRVIGLSVALFWAVVTAKLMVRLKHALIGSEPAVLDGLLRIAVYTGCVVAALILEMGFEVREAYTGFLPAVAKVIEYPDRHQITVNAIWMAVAVLGFELLRTLRRQLGSKGYFQVPVSHDKPEQHFDYTGPKR
jgi:hypothetical protein